MISPQVANKIYDHIFGEGCDIKTIDYYISLIEEEIRKEPDPDNKLVMEGWIEITKNERERISLSELKKGTDSN